MSKILMIDDDPLLLEMLQEQVEESGHLVLKATEGDKALKLFQDTRPDLVILDVIMPGVDGLELLRQFKGIQPDFKSIVLSGLNSDELKKKAEELGADRYYVKPVAIEDFIRVIKHLTSQ